MNLDNFDFEKCYDEVKKILDKALHKGVNVEELTLSIITNKVENAIDEVIFKTIGNNGPHGLNDVLEAADIRSMLMDLYEKDTGRSNG